jgi:methylglyoxal synthase
VNFRCRRIDRALWRKSGSFRIHRKNIALVAHDHRKRDLIEWAEWNYRTPLDHHLVCTGTTGRLIEAALRKRAGSDD